MGLVRDFVKGLDNSKEIDQALTETLTVLSQLAQAKLAGYRDEMDKSWTNGDSNMAAGTIKDFIREETHVIVTDDASALRNSVTGLVKKATKLGRKPDDGKAGGGDTPAPAAPDAKGVVPADSDADDHGERVANFIGSVVSDSLDTILGSGSAGEDTTMSYVIYPDHGFLMRMDVRLWRWNIFANSLTSKTKSVVAYRVQYGVIDYARADPVFIAHWFAKTGDKHGDIRPLIKEAQDILGMFNTGGNALALNGGAAVAGVTMTPVAPPPKQDMSRVLEARRQLLEQRNIK